MNLQMIYILASVLAGIGLGFVVIELHKSIESAYKANEEKKASEAARNGKQF